MTSEAQHSQVPVVVAVVAALATVVAAVAWPEWIRWEDEDGQLVEASTGGRLLVHLVITAVVVLAIAKNRDGLLFLGGLALAVAVAWSLLEPLAIEQQSDSQVLATVGRNAWWGPAALGVAAIMLRVRRR